MNNLPETSITLIKSIAGNEACVRWYEFYREYVPGLKGYVRANFPTVDPDDIVQDAFVALVKCLPDYVYTPDERGHFRSYLIGIVKHKALDAIRRAGRESARRDRLERAQSEDLRVSHPLEDEEERTWKVALLESALSQLLADPSIDERKREIFRRVAVAHEKPDAVAAAFGTTRGNVDVIKKRMLEKLQARVDSLKRARESAQG